MHAHVYEKKRRRRNVHSLVVVLLNDDICFAYSYSILMGFLGRTWEIINLFAISFYWCWIFHSLYFHPFCGANICNRDPYVYAQKVPRSFFTQFYVTFIWKSIEIYRHRKGREEIEDRAKKGVLKKEMCLEILCAVCWDKITRSDSVYVCERG